jgi:hypothetical protein
LLGRLVRLRRAERFYGLKNHCWPSILAGGPDFLPCPADF